MNEITSYNSLTTFFLYKFFYNPQSIVYLMKKMNNRTKSQQSRIKEKIFLIYFCLIFYILKHYKYKYRRDSTSLKIYKKKNVT